MHPVRAVKRAVTPKPIKEAQRALHPIDNAIYSLERSLNSKPRASRRSASSAKAKSKAPVFNHGSCSVNHQPRRPLRTVATASLLPDRRCVVAAGVQVTAGSGQGAKLSSAPCPRRDPERSSVPRYRQVSRHQGTDCDRPCSGLQERSCHHGPWSAGTGKSTSARATVYRCLTSRTPSRRGICSRA